MNTIVIFFAVYVVWIIALIVASYVLWRLPKGERLTFLSMIICSVIIGFILVKLASSLHYSPRPFVLSGQLPLVPHAPDNGFPSEHMFVSTLMALLLYRYARTLAYFLLCLAILVGLARVQADVHHLQDVLGSLALATLTVIFANIIVNHFNKTQSTEKQT